jgi:pimeloyl-ACP methyl ester carboxylesterase
MGITHQSTTHHLHQLTHNQHVPAHFNPTTKHLEAAGYDCIGVDLPGNTTPPRLDDGRLIGIEDDLSKVRQVVLSQLEAGKEVVVVTHSYGCIPGLAALTDLATSTRLTQNQPGGVKAVVTIAGFLCPPGGTMLAAMGGRLLPQYLHEVENDTTLPFAGPGAIHVLYNDLSINEALKSVWLLKPQSYGINTSVIPSQVEGIKGIPMKFLLCRNDNATPWEAQTGSVLGFRGAGVEVYAEVAESGHSPFLKVPEETARFIRRAAGEEIESGFSVY